MAELKEIGRVPSSEAERKQLAQPLLNVIDEYVELVIDHTKDAASRGAKEVVQRLNKSGKLEITERIEKAKKPVKPIKPVKPVSRVKLPFSVEEFSEIISEQLKKKTFEASQRTLERLVGRVMENLDESYQQGLGIKDAADKLEEVFESMEDYELVRVARTEINQAQNYGAMLTEQELGVEYHQWWTAEDERVRDTHIEMHGQIVRVGDEFSNGLVRPGDTNGELEEFINCRCRVVPFLMPEGMTAPPGANYFYEDDLIEIIEERR